MVGTVGIFVGVFPEVVFGREVYFDLDRTGISVWEMVVIRLEECLFSKLLVMAWAGFYDIA